MVAAPASATCLGVLLVAYTAAHPLDMGWVMFGATLVLCGLIAALLALFRWKPLLVAVPLALVGFVAGWLGMTKVVLARPDPRPVPELTRAKDDPGLGHTAVVYFTHGEPETYNHIGWINQFNEFDEQGIPLVPLIARPFFFKGLRDKYREVGKSDHVKVHGEMIHSLESAYRAEGDTTTKFYLSFLDANPRPDAAVIRALNEGASKIIVSEVFLTISNHTAEGEEQVKEVVEEFEIVPVEYTGPLYDSDALKSMFIQRAAVNIGHKDKSKVGILLVGHGQRVTGGRDSRPFGPYPHTDGSISTTVDRCCARSQPRKPTVERTARDFHRASGTRQANPRG